MANIRDEINKVVNPHRELNKLSPTEEASKVLKLTEELNKTLNKHEEIKKIIDCYTNTPSEDYELDDFIDIDMEIFRRIGYQGKINLARELDKYLI